MDNIQDKETNVQEHHIVQAEIHQEDEQLTNILPSPTHQTPSSNELGSGLVPNIPQNPIHQIQSSNELGSGLELNSHSIPKEATKEHREAMRLKSVNNPGCSETILFDDTRRKSQNASTMRSKVTDSLNVIDKLFRKWKTSSFNLRPKEENTLIAD